MKTSEETVLLNKLKNGTASKLDRKLVLHALCLYGEGMPMAKAKGMVARYKSGDANDEDMYIIVSALSGLQ